MCASGHVVNAKLFSVCLALTPVYWSSSIAVDLMNTAEVQTLIFSHELHNQEQILSSEDVAGLLVSFSCFK